MGLIALAWAWQQEGLDPTEKLVLLALADHHNESTGKCCPSIETLAKRTNISQRSVQRNLSMLEDRGLVRRSARYGTIGDQRPNDFVLLAPKGGVTPASGGGDVHVTGGVTSASPRTVSKNQREPKGSLARPRNEVWDTLTDIFGEATTESARSRRGKVCRSLTSAGATPEEMIRRAKSWGRHFDNATLTETALEKHWDVLGRTPMRLEERRGRVAH